MIYPDSFIAHQGKQNIKSIGANLIVENKFLNQLWAHIYLLFKNLKIVLT